jgi:hypothetical protein
VLSRDFTLWKMLVATVLSAALAAPACGQQIGAAGIGPSYQFTNVLPTCEEAQVMAAMHAPVHKFRLVPPYGTTLLQFWQTDAATVCITSLPFQSLVFWATPTLLSNVYGPNIASPAYYQQNYNELYALAVWLRTAYVGTGRAFYIGNWETDNMNGGFSVTPSQTTFQNEIGWFNIRQKAINDAIAATPTSDVMVYHYVEVNAVQTAMSGSARVINSVVPYLNPMPDFVSYTVTTAYTQTPRRCCLRHWPIFKSKSRCVPMDHHRCFSANMASRHLIGVHRVRRRKAERSSRSPKRPSSR